MKYEVWFINSISKTGFTIVNAHSKGEAAEKVKKMFGDECGRITDIYEVKE